MDTELKYHYKLLKYNMVFLNYSIRVKIFIYLLFCDRNVFFFGFMHRNN